MTGQKRALHLTRWTVTSGSNSQSRGAVVLAAGERHWRASAQGNGPIDALYAAVDKALVAVLGGHPRLLAYDIHALGEGPDAVGAVTVRVAPPPVEGERGVGDYLGEASSTNIIAASIEAYISALDTMLGEAHWSGAAASAAATGAKGTPSAPVSARAARERRADLDEDEGEPDTTAWFER
jgi:LeuA allosteric (dimerisation) domain